MANVKIYRRTNPSVRVIRMLEPPKPTGQVISGIQGYGSHRGVSGASSFQQEISNIELWETQYTQYKDDFFNLSLVTELAWLSQRVYGQIRYHLVSQMTSPTSSLVFRSHGDSFQFEPSSKTLSQLFQKWLQIISDNPDPENIPDDAPVSDEELRWVKEHFLQLKQEFGGEWIAVVGTEVVAHGADLATVKDILDQLGVSDPFIKWIPPQDDDQFIMAV